MTKIKLQLNLTVAHIAHVDFEDASISFYILRGYQILEILPAKGNNLNLATYPGLQLGGGNQPPLKFIVQLSTCASPRKATHPPLKEILNAALISNLCRNGGNSYSQLAGRGQIIGCPHIIHRIINKLSHTVKVLITAPLNCKRHLALDNIIVVLIIVPKYSQIQKLAP